MASIFYLEFPPIVRSTQIIFLKPWIKESSDMKFTDVPINSFSYIFMEMLYHHLTNYKDIHVFRP